MKVAAIQFNVGRDVKENYTAILRGLNQAILEGADILTMPEGALSGYTHDFLQDAVSDYEKKLIQRAREAKINLALSTCYYENDGKCYNQTRVYNREGLLVGTHAKILRCGNPDNLKLGEKTVYSTKELEVFEIDDIKIACLICNDLWANPQWTEEADPHFTRQLSQMGAKIILHSVNSGYVDNEYMEVVKQYHESNLKIRACADNLWIVTVNSSYNDYPCSCSSGVISPLGKYEKEANGLGEQFFVYEIN